MQWSFVSRIVSTLVTVILLGIPLCATLPADVFDATVLAAMSLPDDGPDTMIPVTPRIRELACALPGVFKLAQQLGVTAPESALAQLCSDVHKGVAVIPSNLLQRALEEALGCLKDVQIRLARDLAVHWLFRIQQYLVNAVQVQLGIEPITLPDPEDDLQIIGEQHL